MFNRSRKKIIISIMSLLIFLFVVTLTVIIWASYREVREKNSEMLDRYVDIYHLDQRQEGPGTIAENPADSGKPNPEENTGQRQGNAPDQKQEKSGLGEPKPGQGDMPPDLGPSYELSTFYSVTFDKEGNIKAVNNGENGLYDEDRLVEIARSLLTQSKTRGRLDNLFYKVSSKPGYTLVAFIDSTVTESSLKTLLRNVLIVGGIAIVVLFFISLYLSKQIIKPLEENDKKQKRFISDASHELKTPIAVIGTNAELLSREIGENEWLANIQYENERMGDLVKQLLDLSRAENADVIMETLDLSRIVTGEVLALESLAFDRGKNIESDIADDIHISGNQTQLTQLISVLIDNAIRHSVGSEIDVSLRKEGHQAILSVANEGEEMTSDQLEHLFDRFYRVDEARNSEGHHYGLGLSIAKAVANKHGGNINVTYKEGKIYFTVNLPAKK